MLHIKKIKPMLTNLVTTADRFEEDYYNENILIANAGELKLWQKVVAVGPMVRDIAIGDMVMINAEHYAKKKYDKNSLHNEVGDNYTVEYAFNWVIMDDEKSGKAQDYLLLNDRDILYSFEGEEVKEKGPNKKKLILPKAKTLIMN